MTDRIEDLLLKPSTTIAKAELTTSCGSARQKLRRLETFDAHDVLVQTPAQDA